MSTAALRASEIQYRRLFEAAKDGILMLDAETGEITDVNPFLADLLGYKAAEIVGHKLWEISPFEDETKSKILFKVLQSTAYIRYDDVPLETRHGHLIDVEFVSNIYISDGRPVIQCNIRDITARRTAERAVVTTEDRMRFALESAQIGIWDLDYATGVLHWSAVLEAQFGLVPGTFEGTFDAFITRVHPDDRTAVTTAINEATKRGTDFKVRYRTIRPDGSVRTLSGAGRVLTDDDGQALRASGISQDVTEHDAQQAQLLQARKMEAIGRLAGGVAHDFNNLLTVILGCCEMLLDGGTHTDEDRRDLEQIQNAGARAAELTRQLLAFSRKQIIVPTVLDVGAIFTDMRPLLARLIREDVRVVISSSPDLARITADRSQLEQVILNLAVNAQDAMPKGGTLTIGATNVELGSDGRFVVITVSDTGAGMTDEVRQRVFEPFFTTKEPGEGTGLGLATVHGIVTQSGGTVRVTSAPGRGSTFEVSFPQAEASDTAEEWPALHRAPLSGSETVLVVDDEAGLRNLTKRLLERLGYNVVVAADANEAVRLFDENPSIAVVLTDVVMPGLSGPDMIKQVSKRRPDVRVVYMSGYTDEAIVQHGVLKPGIAFMHKPFTADALSRKLREVLDAPAPAAERG